MMKNRVIFLDIDGVLNSYRSMYAYKSCQLDPVAIDLVNALVEESGALVVISSTHRGHGIDKWKFEILDSIPGLKLHPDWFTPWINVCDRGAEIQAWLDAHDEVAYVIIDDDNDGSHPEHQLQNLVHVNDHYGFSHNDYERALELFKNQN